VLIAVTAALLALAWYLVIRDVPEQRAAARQNGRAGGLPPNRAPNRAAESGVWAQAVRRIANLLPAGISYFAVQ
jgi:hypothetical protein